MNYAKLLKTDLVNGEGIRTTLFVTGCNHKCAGCYNKSTWNPRDGEPLTQDVIDEIFQTVAESFIQGLSLTGGDPLYPGNLADTIDLLKQFRARFGSKKDVWLWTGFQFDDIPQTVLELVDVVIDGKYEADNPTSKPFRGSDNQRLFRKSEKGFICEN